MRPIHTIIVHHTASPVGTDLEDVREWHYQRGYSDVGYHYLVTEEGLRIGRPLHLMGAHDMGQNAGTIGICIAGDYTEGRAVPLHMWLQLVHVCADMCQRFKLQAGDIEGHGEVEPYNTPTECPGFNPAALRADVTTELQRRVRKFNV